MADAGSGARVANEVEEHSCTLGADAFWSAKVSSSQNSKPEEVTFQWATSCTPLDVTNSGAASEFFFTRMIHVFESSGAR